MEGSTVGAATPSSTMQASKTFNRVTLQGSSIGFRSSDLKRMQKRLDKGQRSAWRLRLFVSGSMSMVSLCCAAIFFFFYVKNSALKDGCERAQKDYWFAVIGGLASSGRYIFINLAPLATDHLVMRMVLFFMALSLLGDWNWADRGTQERLVDDNPIVVWAITICRNLHLACAIGAILLIFQRSVTNLQERMWVCTIIILLVNLAVAVSVGIFRYAECHRVMPIWVMVAIRLLALWAFCHPPWRHVCQKVLLNMYSSHHAYQAAASIAGLVGNCSAAEAFELAGERFRSVQLARLDYDDLKDNTPNPALFERTTPSELRHCDAFISHSWHDDPEEKWKALQAWRAEFIQENGREPELWFDKCCIDQNNIEDDLRCLPVFLCGCQKLVVLLGPTYLRRLWCIIELFTFAHMQRGLDALEFISLGGGSGDGAFARRQIRSFDAHTCECFNAADKVRLLRIIFAACGDLDRFNEVVKGMFLGTTPYKGLDSESSWLGGGCRNLEAEAFFDVNCGEISTADSDSETSSSEEDSNEDEAEA